MDVLLLRRGQPDRESSAPLNFALHADSAAVRVSDLLSDGQAQATATARPAARPADASGTRGLKDRREADASSVVQTLTYHPGKPIAGQGLEIATVRPRFSVTVQAISRPRNPTVRILFGRDGRVRRAEFVRVKGRRMGTGSVHIDGPLMDAIYRWTAKGVALESLGKKDTLPVEIHLLLNGS